MLARAAVARVGPQILAARAAPLGASVGLRTSVDGKRQAARNQRRRGGRKSREQGPTARSEHT